MNPQRKPVIVLEFNELSPALMTRFIDSGHLPNFRRFRDESHLYVTDAEEEGDNLQPWVQWVTVHNGVSASEFGITRLSDGHKLQLKAVWDVLSDAGLNVWVCGSMNARYDLPLNGYVLPDPWSTGLQPYPEKTFHAYEKFVRHAVQEHTNDTAGLSKWDALAFLGFMATHGLSFATVRKILKQLWTEKRTGKFRWRRAELLDRLQWDVFRSFYVRHRPDFATFFLNSTAHFQHCHWRNMEPEAFSVKPTPAEQDEFQDAILRGYQNMDDLVGRFLRLAEPNATLIFCTALSQRPYADADETGGRHFYRLKNPGVLTEQLGLAPNFTYHSVMAEQFVLRYASPQEASQAKDTLGTFRVGARLAFNTVQQENDLMVQCTQTQALAADTVIKIEASERTLPFFDIFYEMDNLKSGHHHPDGMLWIRYPNRQHALHEEKVSLRTIAPTILDLFGVAAPEHMSGQRLGTLVADAVSPAHS